MGHQYHSLWGSGNIKKWRRKTVRAGGMHGGWRGAPWNAVSWTRSGHCTHELTNYLCETGTFSIHHGRRKGSWCSTSLAEPFNNEWHGGGGLSVFRGVAFGNLPLFTLQATPIKLNGSPQQHQEDMKVVGGHYGKKGFSTSERKMRKGDVGVKVIKIYMYEIIK